MQWRFKMAFKTLLPLLTFMQSNSSQLILLIDIRFWSDFRFLVCLLIIVDNINLSIKAQPTLDFLKRIALPLSTKKIARVWNNRLLFWVCKESTKHEGQGHAEPNMSEWMNEWMNDVTLLIYEWTSTLNNLHCMFVPKVRRTVINKYLPVLVDNKNCITSANDKLAAPFTATETVTDHVRELKIFDVHWIMKSRHCLRP